MNYKVYIFFACLCACKPQPVQNQNDGGRRQFKELYASDEAALRSTTNVFYQLFKTNYQRQFEPLPKTGSVDPEKIPYTGSWYPQAKGGTAADFGDGNSLAKYDQAFNKDNPNKAVAWESSKQHNEKPGKPLPNWAGHCNGYSASASRHKEPTRSVTIEGVTFTARNIKALLAEIYYSAKYYFLAGGAL